jgi:hypothetical protein
MQTMTGLTQDQRSALQEAYMKMLEQFPESIEGDDMQEDSEVENEVEVKVPEKGGALMMAFDKMRGK